MLVSIDVLNLAEVLLLERLSKAVAGVGDEPRANEDEFGVVRSCQSPGNWLRESASHDAGRASSTGRSRQCARLRSRGGEHLGDNS